MACRLISLEAALTSGSWTMPMYRRTESLGGSRSEMELKSRRSRGTGRLLECVRTALDVSRISYDAGRNQQERMERSWSRLTAAVKGSSG